MRTLRYNAFRRIAAYMAALNVLVVLCIVCMCLLKIVMLVLAANADFRFPYILRVGSKKKCCRPN